MSPLVLHAPVLVWGERPGAVWPLFPPPLAASHAAFCARTTEAEGSSRSPTSLSKVVPVLGVPNVGVPALDGAGSGALPFPLSLGWAVGFPGEGLDSNCSSANLQRSSVPYCRPATENGRQWGNLALAAGH